MAKECEPLEMYQAQMGKNIKRLFETYDTAAEFIKDPEKFLHNMGFKIEKEGMDEVKKIKELVDIGKFEARMVDIEKIGLAIHPEIASSTSSATSSMTASATSSGI